jgi:hypothetical protein
MARHPKVHEELSRDELDRLEAYAREPGRTIDECVEWLQAEGFVISRSAVGRWKAAFDAEDRFKAAADLARGLMDTATSGKGATDIADAANLKLGQMAFEQLVRMQTDEVVSTKDVLGLSLALRNVVATKRGVELVREEMAGRQKKAAEEARKVADAGGSAAQVVAVIQKAFGIS